MSDFTSIARPYARAAFAWATDKNNVDASEINVINELKGALAKI